MTADQDNVTGMCRKMAGERSDIWNVGDVMASLAQCRAKLGAGSRVPLKNGDQHHCTPRNVWPDDCWRSHAVHADRSFVL
ncbi:hypothetical protein BN2476_630067 [Paraburkholderia piptadeniae]|uniref:Uncharacterized protein n=1 Tax=Paraburkholderia piptadeniae TaxID=1701573 RepID=A0A1N7SLI9_9BURK|nr:hypothetical protein BN2476_630067 [Paraburkholderia piptadeniae]